MTVSRQPQINEELLSAYLDDQVTEEERALVEAAIATDPAIAWQVDTLRQTIHLLQELPPLALPRAFSLEAILAEVRAEETATMPQLEVSAPKANAPRRTVVTTPTAEPQNNWWQWLLNLSQGGNLQLRNAAAVALTLFFVLFAGDQFLVTTRPLAQQNADRAQVELTSSAHAPLTAATVTVAAVEPTATAAPPTATTLPSDNNATGANAAAEGANSADPSAARTFQSPPSAFAPEQPGPGPVEEDLGGGGGPGVDSRSGPDASMQDNFSAKGSGDQGRTAELAAQAAAPVTGPQSLAASILLTNMPTTTTALTANVVNSVTKMVTSTTIVTTTIEITATSVSSPSAVAESTTAAATPTNAIGRADWLTWGQLFTALSTVVLAGLWWRSRR